MRAASNSLWWRLHNGLGWVLCPSQNSPAPCARQFKWSTVPRRDLRPHAVPMLRRIGQGAVCQDDNARPHRAGLVDDFLARSGVVRMDWPACSPDLNPIENFWDHLERQVRENHPPPATLPALLGLLQQEWLAIPQAFLRRYAMSVRRQCVDCMRSGGGYTHY